MKPYLEGTHRFDISPLYIFNKIIQYQSFYFEIRCLFMSDLGFPKSEKIRNDHFCKVVNKSNYKRTQNLINFFEVWKSSPDSDWFYSEYQMERNKTERVPFRAERVLAE
jgi:hypothetical protein